MSGDRGNHDGGGGVNGRGCGEAVFDLCLTRDERDAVVSRTVEAFSLNQDQARLLWRCARWFRPTEAGGGDMAKGDEGDGSTMKEGQGLGDRGEKGGGEGDATAPVVLVHGVFGECAGTRDRGLALFLWSGCDCRRSRNNPRFPWFLGA